MSGYVGFECSGVFNFLRDFDTDVVLVVFPPTHPATANANHLGDVYHACT